MQKQILVAAAIALALLAGCQRSTTTASGDLDWAVGNWHGTRRDAEDGEKVRMTVRVERLNDGQVERLQVETTPQLYVGFTIRIRDVTGQWTMIYANSTRAKIGRLQGKLDGRQSTWESIAPDQTHGSRFVSEQIDSSHWRRTQFVSEDGGTTWKLLFIDELERD